MAFHDVVSEPEYVGVKMLNSLIFLSLSGYVLIRCYVDLWKWWKARSVSDLQACSNVERIVCDVCGTTVPAVSQDGKWHVVRCKCLVYNGVLWKCDAHRDQERSEKRS